jgi:hypothetical protein
MAFSFIGTAVRLLPKPDHVLRVALLAAAIPAHDLRITPATRVLQRAVTHAVDTVAFGDVAGANNVTITPAAGDIDGAANYVISANRGAAQIAYGDERWQVIDKV